MQAVTLGPSRRDGPRSGERAVALTLIPIAVTVLAVWAELSRTAGTSWLSFLAGAFYFPSPTIGAIAGSRTLSARGPQRIVALTVFAILAWTWFTFVPQPTRPGVWAGGTGTASGLTYAIGGAIVWYWSSRLATYWLNRGLRWVALLLGAAAVAGGSFLAIVLAVSLPLP